MRSIEKNTSTIMPKSLNIRLIRITAFLFCLVVLSAGVFIPSDAQSGKTRGPQKGAVRTRISAPKPPASGQPVVQPRDARILSESQTNADGSITAGQMVTDAPIIRSVAEIMAEQASRPSVEKPAKLMPEREGPEREGLPQNPKSPDVPQWPPADKNAPTPHLGAPQTLSMQFNGATGPTETGAFPPDTMGAVGPTQFFVFLNGRMRTFNKTTGVADGVINADPDVFFSSVLTPPGATEVSFTSDPQVRFDRLSNRWFLVIIDVTLNSTTGVTTKANRILMAVTDAASNGTISATTNWTLYQFQGDATLFTDYESLGIDANALYIGGDMFTLAGSFSSTKGFVIPKAPMLAGANATVWTFSNMVSSSSSAGPFAPRGVDNYDAANTGPTATGYFIGVDNASFGMLTLRRVTNPSTTVAPAPTMSANLFVTVPATNFPVLVPHMGNSQGNNGRLDSLDDRLYAAHLRNGRLWTAHSIGVNNTGTTTSPTRNGARWYELQSLGTTPALVQAGLLFDTTNTSAGDVAQRNYWIPSVMVSGQGHVALGCSIAGTNERVNAFTTGRLSGDSLGAMRDGTGSAAIFPGYTSSGTAYNPASDTGGSGGRRWGDYSFTSLDPLDDMTMWTIQEYCNGTNTYGVRVVKLLAPPPATPTLAAPATVNFGVASTNIVVTGLALNGEGFFDPGTDIAAPAQPFNHITASVTGGVTVNSITYTDPTHITINVSTVGATMGTQNITVTNPDGQTATGIGILTVTGTCPTITLPIGPLPNGTNGTAYNQTLSANGGTAAYSFSVTSGSLPTGLTLSTSGALTGTPTASGTFNFAVTATDVNGCTGFQNYVVSINTRPTASAMAVSRQQASPASNSTIANVSDAEQAASSLTVTVNSGATATVNGVTVSGISVNAAGAVTANVVATCTATNASFTLTVTDSASATNTATLNVTVTANTPPTLAYNNQSVAGAGSLTINPATGPADNGAVNTIAVQSQGAYTGTISVNSSGVVSVSNAAPSGTHTITIRATDDCGLFADTTFLLSVNCQPISITPGTLASGSAGQVYPSAALAAFGGTPGYTFSLLSGALPNGLSLSSDGVISGTPTQAGSFSFMVKATDSLGCAGMQNYMLQIACPAISLTPTSLPSGSTGQLYSQTLSAVGGTPNYSFAVTTGTLPTNITLSSAGALSGTTSQSGSFPFTVTATDANGCTGMRQYTLVICPVISITPATLPNGFVGTAYNATLTTSAGTAPFSFAVTAGALPGGLNLSSGGVLSGTPTAQGTFNFGVTVMDANGCAGVRAYTVIISGDGLVFYPLPRPVRILDTRAGGNCDNVAAAITGGTSITALARLTCEGITIPDTARAITGNVTVLNQTNQIGYMTIYPDGQNAPVAANMIYAANDILSNNFTVGLSADGKFDLFGERTIHAVIDVSGYYAPPASGGLYYHPLPKPVRLLDTRSGAGNCDNVNSPIAAGASITTSARVTCEGVTIPQAAQAIVGNATVINGSGQLGYLTIYPNGVGVPLAANLIYFPGQVLSNAFAVSLDANGRFNIFGEKTIDIAIDVAGYYSNEAVDANGSGLLLTPLSRPLRILDTRANAGNCDNVATPITGGGSIAASGRLTCESLTIPSNAQAILGNVTVLNQTNQLGYLTMYPDGVAQPLAANIIYYPSQILSNAFVVGLNSGTGQYRLFAERTLDAVIDTSAYFAP